MLFSETDKKQRVALEFGICGHTTNTLNYFEVVNQEEKCHFFNANTINGEARRIIRTTRQTRES
jgi:hypothetical protein